MLLHRCILYAQMQGHHMHILNFHAQRKEVVKHWSMEYEGLRFNSPWRLRFFFLSHDCYKTKNIFLYLFTEVEEQRGCHQVWSITFESKGMTFLLIELNEPID